MRAIIQAVIKSHVYKAVSVDISLQCGKMLRRITIGAVAI